MGSENLSTHFNFFSLKNDPSPIAYSFPKKDTHPNPSDFSFDKVEKTEANAAQLGIYSLDQIKQKGLQVLSLKDFMAITKGSYQNGQYSSRVLYLENGDTAPSSKSNIEGRFIINQEYRVQAQPSLSNQNSSQGQYPVNGQYYLQGTYQEQIPLTSSRVLNGQYSTSNKDTVNQQFSISGVVNAKGEILEGGPFFITKAELLNGRYQVQIQNLQGSSLQIGGQNIQIGSVKSEQGQLLVNGVNSIQGQIRPLNQFTQKATLLIEGNYNTDGTYEINGVTLENGSNTITTRYRTGNIQGTATATVQGRYTSGGQFVVTQSQETIVNSSNPNTSKNLSNFETIQKRLQETFQAYSNPLPGKILKLKG